MAASMAFERNSLEESISEISVEQLLNLWEQSQRIFFALQDALPASIGISSVSDTRISMELLRRALQNERAQVTQGKSSGKKANLPKEN